MDSIHQHTQLSTRRQFLRNTLFVLPAAASLLTLLPSQVSSAPASRYGILGQRAPTLKMDYWIDSQGEQTQFNPGLLSGKWVYMKFFQGWCPGCHKYGFPALQKVHKAFGDNGKVAILAIQTVFEGFAFNTKGRLRDMQERYDLPILMGHDAGEFIGNSHPRTMQTYRSGGTPWVVIINPAGNVIYNDFHIDADRFIAYLTKRLT